LGADGAPRTASIRVRLPRWVARRHILSREMGRRPDPLQGSSITEHQRIDRLAKSGVRIEDPEDAALVQAWLRYSYKDLSKSSWLIWTALGLMATFAVLSLASGAWVASSAFLGLAVWILLARKRDVRVQRQFATTAAANGWPTRAD
jgi:hypothetical protein